MWQIEHQRAVWKSRRFAGHVDLARPSAGLHHLRCGCDEWLNASIHQVTFPSGDADAWEFIDDAYVRHDDLIVCYRESASTALRTQLQWHVHERPDSLVLLELTASVQTPAHDCDPRLCVTTSLPGSCWHVHDGAQDCQWDVATQSSFEHVALAVPAPGVVLLNAGENTGPCFGQAIPATDLVAAQLERNQTTSGSSLSQIYFANRLEKGVLRRVRLQAYLTLEACDIAVLRSTALQALHQSPPLDA